STSRRRTTPSPSASPPASAPAGSKASSGSAAPSSNGDKYGGFATTRSIDRDHLGGCARLAGDRQGDRAASGADVHHAPAPDRQGAQHIESSLDHGLGLGSGDEDARIDAERQ